MRKLYAEFAKKDVPSKRQVYLSGKQRNTIGRLAIKLGILNMNFGVIRLPEFDEVCCCITLPMMTVKNSSAGSLTESMGEN